MPKEEPPILKSEETENLEKKLEEVRKGVQEMSQRDEEEDKKILAISLKMGLTDKELLDAGFTQDQIDSAKTPVAPENTEPKVDQKIADNEGENPREKKEDASDILFQKLTQRAKERLDDEYTLAKLIVERDMLRRQENQISKEKEVESTKKEIDTVLQEKKPTEENVIANQYLDRKETPTSKKYEELRETFEKIKPWQIWKIWKFLKARFQFGPVQKKLMREMEQEDFEKKTSHMTLDEVKSEYDRLRKINKKIWFIEFHKWKEAFKNGRDLGRLSTKYFELKRSEVENTTE